MFWTEQFEKILQALLETSTRFYGDRLISVVAYGSVGRRAMRPDSDIDLLFVIDPLPKGRLRRVEEFRGLERQMEEGFMAGGALGGERRGVRAFKSPPGGRAG